jgi:CDP-glycerol glycerophosphotransferase
VKLSVVVPIYNVEAYLADALASVAGQTLRDLEVIMVDDGSTDGSALIAKSFAASDPRFHLVQQENKGLGPARNAGTRLATGTYLAFFDSDDVLPRHAYELLVGSLEATGSDIAAGGVRRFTSGWLGSSFAHGNVFRETIKRTTAAKFPALLRDCTAWNKVYRRSFWDSTGLTFPVGRYEDTPVTIPAYALARSIDVLRDVVYYWRARESGDLSRDQRARELENVEGRMASVLKASRFLSAHAPALKPAYDRDVLDTHLGVLVRAFEFVSEPERERLLALARDYLSSVDDSVFRNVKVIQRLRYYLIREGMHAEFLELMRYSRRGDAATAPLVRLGRPRSKWYIAYPYFADPSRNIPLDVYEARAIRLDVQLDEVRWHGDKLRIEGYAYIRRLDAPLEQDTRIDVLLRNPVLRRTVRLKVKRVKRPDVTARSGQAAACYDWSGFVVEIDPARLSNLGTWRAASWELRVRVRGHGVRREGPVKSVVPGSALWPEARWVAAGVRLQPAPEPGGRFTIRADRPGALATACRADSDQLQLEGWSATPLGPKAAIVVSLQQGGGKPTRIPATATGTSAGRYGFRAAVPVSTLLSAAGSGNRPGNGQGPLASTGEPAAAVGDEIHWDFALQPGTGGKVRLAGEPGVIGHRRAQDGQELTTYLTAFGNLSAVQRKCRLIVRDASWTAGDRFTLRGDFPGTGAKPTVILLRSTGSGYQHMMPLRWQDDTFEANLSPGAMPGLAGDLPLAAGRWELLAQTKAGETTRVVADRRLLTRLPEPREVGIHRVTADSYRGDALQIRVRSVSADAGKYPQRKLQEWYHSNTGGRIDDIAIFDSHGARQYSCNPRAIYEELRRRDSGLQCMWITRDGQFRVPDGGRVVVFGSREHYELASRARFLVSNMLQKEWYRKPAGQVYLQTWHGTPLKRICLDVERPQFANAIAYNDRVRRDVTSWSAMISPNTFSTPIFRRAFGFDGEILEFGYPRNDLLASPESSGRAAGIRRQLGLSADQRIVLYAPTWRDDATTRAGGYGFPQHLDLGAFARSLGDEHVTLVRAHVNMKEALVTDPDSRVMDVTLYPDIADLLLIADVLITDYSSAMFDFAVTGRPMLFFTYDLERYRDRLRGFYFDFEAEAPGPLLRTTDDVIGAMQSLPDISRSYRSAYDSFTERFCALEDGQAAARAVDWLLSHSG